MLFQNQKMIGIIRKVYIFAMIKKSLIKKTKVMKKLKVFALALVAAFGFSACEEDPQAGVDYEVTTQTAVFVGAGSNTTAGSYVTADGTVYKAADIKTNGSTSILFVGDVKNGAATVSSGTTCANGYVNGVYAEAGKGILDEPWSSQASETKFNNIKKRKAEAADIYKMEASEFTLTDVAVEAGDYVAFYNATLGKKGWLYIKSIATSDAATSGIIFDYTIVTLK